MKKLVILIIIFLILVLGYQYRSNRLKSQLLEEAGKPSQQGAVSSVCDTYSEDVANECYLSLALEKKDSSFCARITKQRKQNECLREVDFL